MEVSDRHRHQEEEEALLLHHQEKDLEQDSHHHLLEGLELDLLLRLQLLEWVNSIETWGKCPLHHLHRVVLVVHRLLLLLVALLHLPLQVNLLPQVFNLLERLAINPEVHQDHRQPQECFNNHKLLVCLILEQQNQVHRHLDLELHQHQEVCNSNNHHNNNLRVCQEQLQWVPTQPELSNSWKRLTIRLLFQNVCSVLQPARSHNHLPWPLPQKFPSEVFLDHLLPVVKMTKK
mmetsp:Transcript_36817/g.89404  ORF Transcript_36817/g.89404 Transcript_36817/m.89404 type:complete len:233 (-) Transcript_36817:2341-3039(-)